MKNNIIALLILSLFHLSASSVATTKSPWDLIVVDISGDQDCHDKEGKSEGQLLDIVLSQLNKNAFAIDSVMVFAQGRMNVPFGKLRKRDKAYSDFLLNCIGDGTSIYDAMLSVVNRPEVPGRVLVVTNGVDNGSSFHHATTARILRDKGVRVDGLCINIPADSIAWDSVYYAKQKYDGRFGEAVKATGGKYATASKVQDVRDALSSLMKDTSRQDKPSKHGKDAVYNKALLDNTLGRISPRRLCIQEVDTAASVRYNGQVMKGLSEIKRALGNAPGLTCNRILHDNIPLDMLPAVYYSGEGDKMSICGFELVNDLFD